jgi:hypothetical protein
MSNKHVGPLLSLPPAFAPLLPISIRHVGQYLNYIPQDLFFEVKRTLCQGYMKCSISISSLFCFPPLLSLRVQHLSSVCPQDLHMTVSLDAVRNVQNSVQLNHQTVSTSDYSWLTDITHLALQMLDQIMRNIVSSISSRASCSYPWGLSSYVAFKNPMNGEFPKPQHILRQIGGGHDVLVSYF